MISKTSYSHIRRHFLHCKSNRATDLSHPVTNMYVSTRCKRLDRINGDLQLYHFARKHSNNRRWFLLVPEDIIQVFFAHPSFITRPIHG